MKIINNNIDNNKIENKINNKDKKFKKLRPVFRNRHMAREFAVQFLYSLDRGSINAEANNSQKFEELLDLFLNSGGIAEQASPEVKDYLCFLSRGTWNAKTEIDEILLRVVSGWRPERINAVDRAILRLAIFEGFIAKEHERLPLKSAISEAVSISDTFGAEKSSRFIHGVLAKVSKYILNRDIFGDE